MYRCMVQWEGDGEWRGPFEVHRHGTNWVKLENQDGYYPTIPRSWTLGVDDGWTLWEGGERPVPDDATVEYIMRVGNGTHKGIAIKLGWCHDNKAHDIIAYRVVKEAPKTLDQAWDEDKPSLSAILNDWWLNDLNVWRRVGAWDLEDDHQPFEVGEWVPRDWFTGRRHLTTEELAEEMEG